MARKLLAILNTNCSLVLYLKAMPVLESHACSKRYDNNTHQFCGDIGARLGGTSIPSTRRDVSNHSIATVTPLYHVVL